MNLADWAMVYPFIVAKLVILFFIYLILRKVIKRAFNWHVFKHLSTIANIRQILSTISKEPKQTAISVAITLAIILFLFPPWICAGKFTQGNAFILNGNNQCGLLNYSIDYLNFLYQLGGIIVFSYAFYRTLELLHKKLGQSTND